MSDSPLNSDAPSDLDSSDAPDLTPEEQDASRGEVAIYAFGNVESAVADNFPQILQNILIVVAQVNPLLLGMVMGIRFLWDGIMDPIMAHISDNTRSKYGRRRPYILFGGVARSLFLIAFIALMPLGNQVADNHLMEAQKNVNESTQVATRTFETVAKTYEQLPDAAPELQAKLLDMLEGQAPQSWISQIIGLISTDKDHSFITQASLALSTIQTSLPTLEADLTKRKQRVIELQQAFSEIKAQQISPDSETYQKANGLLEAAKARATTTEDLIAAGRKAQAKAIAIEFATRYLLQAYDRSTETTWTTPEIAQSHADAAITALSLETIDIFTLEPRPAPKPRAVNPPFHNIRQGVKAFFDPSNFEQRTLIIYLLVAYLIFATLTTINSAPYYALGIELSPSYEGRTQVVVYRSVMNQIAGLLAPWVPVFCFSLYFTTAIDALFWVAVLVCLVGIPSTVLMFFKTRERTHPTIKKANERANLFKSMWQIGKEREFLRILFLFVFVGLVNGLFQQIGFFLNVYWVTGSALSGAMLGAQVAMIAWGLGLLTLPLIKWACDRFQKHRVLQFAIIWMSLGTSLKWWLMNPEHPEYQFILPFFFSVGIGAIYNVLPTMMADITDLDELQYGVRREGMFGAVMGFLMKLIGTVTPIAAGAVLLMSGFDAGLEYRQDPNTIHNMRLMYSIIPACMLLFALFALRNYPLTRERVVEIKAKLKQRHQTSATS